MGLDGLWDLIGTVAKWWTPEQVKARATDKLRDLKNERKKILKQESLSDSDINKLNKLDANITRLQEYLKTH